MIITAIVPLDGVELLKRLVASKSYTFRERLASCNVTDDEFMKYWADVL
jgi:hypothetical protein